MQRAFCLGKGGRDAFLAQKVIDHKQRFSETANVDWLIHAARAAASLSNEARAKLARAGVITGGDFEPESLDYRRDRNGHTVPPCVTPAIARMLCADLHETWYLYGRN
jgi:hypothetical protein